MRGLIIGILLTFATALESSAQYYFYNGGYYDKDLLVEAGINIGGMNVLADVGGRKGLGKKFIKDIVWKNTQLCAGLYTGIIYKDKVGLRLEGTFGTVKGFDSDLKQYSSNPETKPRYDRNLNFRSKIREITLIGEIYPLTLFSSGLSEYAPSLSPYVMVGIGGFYFEPQTYYNGTWVNLAKLHLEGQGFPEYPDRQPYKQFQYNIPFGIGVKYEATPKINVRFEMLHRFLFTDYLDDVSTKYIDPALFDQHLSPADAALAKQLYYRGGEIGGPATPLYTIRGNPNDYDYYFSFNLKVGWVFGREVR